VLLTTKSPNNTVRLINGNKMQINNIYLPENQTHMEHIEMWYLKKKKSIYNYPCDSKYLSAWTVTKRYERIGTYKINEIQKK